MVRGGATRSYFGLALAVATACETVDYSAPDFQAPVLVGPVRPEPPSCVATRRTPVTAEASFEYEWGYRDPTGVQITQDREVRVSDEAVSNVLDSAVGLCAGCWVTLDAIRVDHLDFWVGGHTKVRGLGNATHVISVGAGAPCSAP
jgi:hypothetical protein